MYMGIRGVWGGCMECIWVYGVYMGIRGIWGVYGHKGYMGCIWA